MKPEIEKLFDLSGHTALVTGGSRGLGLQVAEVLADAGAKLVITSRKAADIEQAAAHLRERGAAVTAIAADASDPLQVEKVCSEALRVLGHVDILVNNAGASWGAPAEDHPLEAWDKVMNLNVRSVFLFSQHIAKHSMIPRKSGRIIMMASIAGLAGNRMGPASAAYNTSKGAVVNLTRQLAAEWGRYGITVNALAPGFFPSKMTYGTLDRLGVDNIAAGVPLRRIGDDEDLKGATLLFASRAGKHITGQVLAVDGGVSCVFG
jgi:NAD(P)-dependent dehydrogenase (short-subunit alcohol dehydrogenase family)